MERFQAFIDFLRKNQWIFGILITGFGILLFIPAVSKKMNWLLPKVNFKEKDMLKILVEKIAAIFFKIVYLIVSLIIAYTGITLIIYSFI